MTAAGYEAAMEDWVERAAHSGPTPSEKNAKYTQLNLVRMRRVAKTYKLSDEMGAFLDSERCKFQSHGHSAKDSNGSSISERCNFQVRLSF